MKSRLLRIAVVSFLVTAAFMGVAIYFLHTRANMGLAIAFMVPLLPGLAIYIITTGDVNFVNAEMGVAVMAIVSWIFWTAIVYAIALRRVKRSAK